MIKVGKRQLFKSPNWKLGFFWNGNVRTAIGSLRRTKWRSFFTMMGVIIGITSVITVVSLGEGVKHQVSGQINKLGSNVLTIRPGKLVQRNAKGHIGKVNLLALLNSSTLSDKDLAVLQKLPDIESVIPLSFVTSSATGDSGSSDNLVVAATTSDFAPTLNLKLGYGSFFNQDDPDNFAVIGKQVAQQLFKSSSPIAHSLNINGSDFLVHGVLEASSGGILSVGQTDFNSSVFISYDSAKKLTGGNLNIVQIMVKTKPSSNLDSAVQNVRGALIANHNGHENFTVLKQYELLDVSNKVVDSLTGFISAIAAISLLVGGIGIMDIMLVAVSERTREIGIRKAIGATNRQILNQFLTEGMVLSIGGGIIGILVSLAINGLLILYTDLHPVITWPIVLAAVLISMAVGIVFSGAPALKAARKLPIDALRGE